MKEFVSKRKTPTGWPQSRYWHLKSGTRRPVNHGENVDFICWYLFENPGATYTQVIRSLCERNSIQYASGQYSNYFNSGHGNNGYVNRLWQRTGPGWTLTNMGLARYGEWCC
jgi:hypothetical protein